MWRQINAKNFHLAKPLTEKLIKKMFDAACLNECIKCEFHRKIVLIVLEFFQSHYQSFALSLLPDVFDLTNKFFEGKTLAEKLIESSESLVKMAKFLTSDEIRQHYQLMDDAYNHLININHLDINQKSKFVFRLSKLYASFCSSAEDRKRKLWVLKKAVEEVETLNSQNITKSSILGLLYCHEGRVHMALKEWSEAKECLEKGISIMKQAVDWNDENEKLIQLIAAEKDFKKVWKKFIRGKAKSFFVHISKFAFHFKKELHADDELYDSDESCSIAEDALNGID